MFGFVLVIVGLAFFMEGLERALFSLGNIMASQLTAPAFLGLALTDTAALQDWRSYGLVYCFAFTLGFTTTVAEPALIAGALKANQASGGFIDTWGLRITVAIGVAVGVSIGAFRIITGTPLHYYIIPGYCLVLIQTWFAPRLIVALAYDSGGVTTSTVTVPLVTALGLRLSNQIPGRNPVFDGFWLIAFASLFPIMTGMSYTQLTES